jgi:hypothetical protein
MHIDASLALPSPGKQIVKMNILAPKFSMRFGIQSMIYDAAGSVIDMPATSITLDALMSGFSE